jgi:RHS repeat-associated protein
MGVGGLEATIRESDGQTTGIISDSLGNSIATVFNAQVRWAATQVASYGPVLGYQPPVLSPNVSLAEATIWRGKRIDPTGLYYFGARHYDPTAGRFLSPDPFGHAASLDLYSFANGDPVNFGDPDGRFFVSMFREGSREAQTLRGAAGLLDSFSSRTHSPLLGGIAELGSQVLNMGADAQTPSTYVNQAIYDFNAQGGGFLGGLGVLNRYNPTKSFYDFGSGIDLIDAHDLSDVERAQAGLFSVGTAAGVTAGLLRATTVGARPPPLPTSPAVAPGGLRIRTNPQTGVVGGLRQQYLGRTPGKGSATGHSVISRMQSDHNLRLVNGKAEVRYVDPVTKVESWHPIKMTDMGHLTDAVKYWNTRGRYLGPKHPEVRRWMLDPANYELEPSGINRSRGAKLRERYLPPATGTGD